MKIITLPTVTILSVPTFSPHPAYQIPEHNFPAESLIAHAGKGCYDSYGSDGRSVSKHIETLVASTHGSVLEHANISVFIEGISRGLSHELVRHRHFSYSQRSTRYANEEDAAIVLDPYYARLYAKKKEGPFSMTLDEAAIINNFIQSCQNSINQYNLQVKWLTLENPDKLAGKDLRKWARGKARQLLPHALETRLTMTGNLRSWRDFFEQRMSNHAEAEIRRLAFLLHDEIVPHAPTVFSDFSWDNGNDEFKPKARKV